MEQDAYDRGCKDTALAVALATFVIVMCQLVSYLAQVQAGLR